MKKRKPYPPESPTIRARAFERPEPEPVELPSFMLWAVDTGVSVGTVQSTYPDAIVQATALATKLRQVVEVIEVGLGTKPKIHYRAKP